MMESCCANCGLETAAEGKVGSSQLQTEFVLENTFEERISVEKAFNTVFVRGIEQSQLHMLQERIVGFCSQCTAILAELYKFYCEFIKLTKQTSTVKKILTSSLLWDGPPDKATEDRNQALAGGGKQHVQKARQSNRLKPSLPTYKEEAANNEPGDCNDDGNYDYGLTTQFVQVQSSHIKFDHFREEEVDSSSLFWPPDVKPDIEYLKSTEVGPGNVSPAKRLKRGRKEVQQPRQEAPWPAEEEEEAEADSDLPKPTQIRIKPKVLAAAEPAKNGVPNFKCSDCYEIFNSRLELRVHRRNKHIQRQLPKIPCDQSGCTQIFISYSKLSCHLVLEHGIGKKLKDRECKLCGKYFSRPCYLTKHIRSAHDDSGDRKADNGDPANGLEADNSTGGELNTKKMKKDQFTCEYCAKTYISYGGLYLHVRQHHVNPQTYICPICKKTSNREGWLAEHLPMHDEVREKKFQCEQCDKGFYRRKNFMRHLKIHARAAEGIKHYQCSTCGDRFAQSAGLRRHVQAKHSEVGPFVCEVCGKEFKIRDYLRQHMRSKTHGGIGHGIYTPAGKLRLQKEMAESEAGKSTPAKTV